MENLENVLLLALGVAIGLVLAPTSWNKRSVLKTVRDTLIIALITGVAYAIIAYGIPMY